LQIYFQLQLDWEKETEMRMVITKCPHCDKDIHEDELDKFEELELEKKIQRLGIGNQIVLKLLMEGKDKLDIANELGLSLGTINGRLNMAVRKLGYIDQHALLIALGLKIKTKINMNNIKRQDAKKSGLHIILQLDKHKLTDSIELLLHEPDRYGQMANIRSICKYLLSKETKKISDIHRHRALEFLMQPRVAFKTIYRLNNLLEYMGYNTIRDIDKIKW